MPLNYEVGLVVVAGEKKRLERATEAANSDSRIRLMKEGYKRKGRKGLERIDFAGYSIIDIDMYHRSFPLTPAYPRLRPSHT